MLLLGALFPLLVVPLVAHSSSSISNVPNTTSLVRSGRSASSRVKVEPKCNKDSITVEVQFDGRHYANGRFTDWIIVGDSGRTECRLRGNGETLYIVTVVVFRDHCNTQMLRPGEFQNTLRIAQYPGIILQDDIHFTFKCTYGTPEAVEYQLPQVSPSFDVNKNLVSNEAPISPPPLFNQPVVDESQSATSFDSTSRSRGGGDGTSSSSIGNSNKVDPFLANTPALGRDDAASSTSISRASNNLLAILLSAFIIVGVCVFLLVLYICFRHLQSNRKAHRHAPIQASGDTETPSSSSPGVLAHDEGPWWSAKIMNAGQLLGTQKTFETRKKHAAPAPPYPLGSLNSEIERAVDVGHLERPEATFRDAFRRNGNSSSATDDVDDTPTLIVAPPRVSQSYAEWRERVLRKNSASAVARPPPAIVGHDTLDKRPIGDEERASGVLTPVHSITEIYRAAETHLKQQQQFLTSGGSRRAPIDDLDASEMSSLEGEYSIPVQRPPLDKDTRDRLVACVSRIRGFGNRRLTEQEIGRWRQLVTNDHIFQAQIAQTKSLDELLSIAELAEQRMHFTRLKWVQIMTCVSECLHGGPPQTHSHQTAHQKADNSTPARHARTERFNW